MRWTVVAPFFYQSSKPIWIDDYAISGKHHFTKICRSMPSESWHSRVGRSTPISEWFGHLRQAAVGFYRTNGGVITVFPQLALIVALLKLVSLWNRNVPIIAWCFNVGACPPEPLRWITSFLLRQIDIFVVHSSGEIDTLNKWFQIPKSKIRFTPLQRAKICVVENQEAHLPFIVSMGSANRDYDTLIAAIGNTDIKCIIVASPRLINASKLPPNFEHNSGLTPDECLRLSQRARINVVVLSNVDTASGQVTVVESMCMGRPVIATRGVGTIDYIESGRNGILVEPNNVESLRAAIMSLWLDEECRERIGSQAQSDAHSNFSDERAGTFLLSCLDDLAD